MQVTKRYAMFCCENSAAMALESVEDTDLLSKFDFVTLPCSGRIESTLLLRTLERGYAGVAVIGCPEDNCKYVSGNKHAKNRVDEVNAILAGAGLEADCVLMDYMSSVDTHKIEKLMRDIVEPRKAEVETE